MSWRALLLWSAWLPLHARTPFEQPNLWCLRGIVITPTQRVAIFADPDGQWALHTPHESIDSSYIEDIYPSGITLRGHPNPCFIPLGQMLDAPDIFIPPKKVPAFCCSLDQVPLTQLVDALARTEFPIELRAPNQICAFHHSSAKRPHFLQGIAQATDLLCYEEAGRWVLSSNTTHPIRLQSLQLDRRSLSEAETSILQAAKILLSAQGKLWCDHEQNRLFLQDNEQNVDAFKRWLEIFDQTTAQILIEARIVMMEEDDFSDFGLQWQQSAGEETTNTSTGHTPTALFKTPFLDLILSALASENRVDVIAKPSILVKNHHTALLKQGNELAYLGSGRSGITFKEAMLTLQATPHLLPDGTIQIEIALTHNLPGEGESAQKKQPPPIHKQELSTQVVLRQDDIVALGGIVAESQRHRQSGLPWLSKLPLIGRLFSARAHTHHKQTLVLFVSAHIQAPTTHPPE